MSLYSSSFYIACHCGIPESGSKGAITSHLPARLKAARRFPHEGLRCDRIVGVEPSGKVLLLTLSRTMDKISQGITEGISRTVRDLPGDTNGELELSSVPQILIGELSDSLSVGVPRRLFDALHHSFSELNDKLASQVEINIAPERDDLVDPIGFNDILQPSPPVFESPQSFDHSDSEKDPDDGLEPSDGPSIGTSDRCCYCLTHASKEELMTTPCCRRSVGSICFEERLKETEKCCLCQAYQSSSDSQYLATPSEDTTDYKYHFIMESFRDGAETKADVETARANLSEQRSSFTEHSAVANVSPTLPNASEALRADTTATKETAVLDKSDISADIETRRMADDRRKRFKYDKPVSLQSLKKLSKDFKLRTAVPDDPTTEISQSAASQQKSEPAKNAHHKPTNSSAFNTATVRAPPTNLQASSGPKVQSPQSKEGGDHHVTKSHRLKLIDRDVIDHLEGFRGGDLLDLVHSALIGRLRQNVCKAFFHQAKFLANGNIEVSICLKCSQESDSMHGMKDWPRAFESFMLTTQLDKYKVTVSHIQIGSMKILQGSEKHMTVETLVRDNSAVLKSLTCPADIRGICWNKSTVGLNLNESTSITITFRTAQQANEAINYGVLWHHERRACRRQGAHPRLIQCAHCQAYGHISKNCCSTPRCRVCAGFHLSAACTYDPAASAACMKCVLCSGPHEATSEHCLSRKAERKRLQLENRFYATRGVKAGQGGTSSAA